MMHEIQTAKAGTGVIIANKEGKVLAGKRTGSHAQYWSIPGGKLDEGETFEPNAIKEIKEESSLEIKNPKVIAVTNNLETFRKEKVHYVSVILLATEFSGEPKIMEPEKCEAWLRADPRNCLNRISMQAEEELNAGLKGSFTRNMNEI